LHWRQKIITSTSAMPVEQGPDAFAALPLLPRDGSCVFHQWRKCDRGLVICRDLCIWIKEYYFPETGRSISSSDGKIPRSSESPPPECLLLKFRQRRLSQFMVATCFDRLKDWFGTLHGSIFKPPWDSGRTLNAWPFSSAKAMIRRPGKSSAEFDGRQRL
jgi:hypothetical protein